MKILVFLQMCFYISATLLNLKNLFAKRDKK